MMRFSEAILLGAMTQPLCRDYFLGHDGSGCLITAAVRACGRKPKEDAEVIAAALDLWPWLVTEVSPTAAPSSPHHRTCAGTIKEVVHSDQLNWIIEAHDIGQMPADWIAQQIAALEDYMDEAVARELGSEEVTCEAQ